MNLVDIQKSAPEHLGFIRHSFIKGFYTSYGRFCENMTPEVYDAHHPAIIDRILRRSEILIATSKEHPDLLVGYFIYEPPDIAHFLYVRHDFKRFGIATELFKKSDLDAKNCRYTHRTGDCVWIHGAYYKEKTGVGSVQKFKKGKYPELIYNPYLGLL